MYIYPRRNPRRIPFLISLIVLILVLGGVFGLLWGREPGQLIAALKVVQPNTPTPTETGTPTEDPNITPTPTSRRTRTPRPTKTPMPSPTLVPTNTPVTVVQHFILGRPVPPDALGLSPARTYLYGSTAQNTQAVHHGEEFVNPAGTPILAVADGEVVTAGDDKEPLCGDTSDQVCGERLDFYGKLVVVQLDQTYSGQPLFTMCGHMRRIDVQIGQHVSAGEPLGTVGASGVAEGPHCHFEVRVGINDYAHTRNPILWMRPLPGTGSVAGIVQDKSGKLLRSVNVFLYLDNDTQDYVQDTETYGRDDHPAVNPDDELHENWAFGDVKAGKYLLRVTIGSLSYLRHITVEEGKLSFVVFGGP